MVLSNDSAESYEILGNFSSSLLFKTRVFYDKNDWFNSEIFEKGFITLEFEPVGKWFEQYNYIRHQGDVGLDEICNFLVFNDYIALENHDYFIFSNSWIWIELWRWGRNWRDAWISKVFAVFGSERMESKFYLVFWIFSYQQSKFISEIKQEQDHYKVLGLEHLRIKATHHQIKKARKLLAISF